MKVKVCLEIKEVELHYIDVPDGSTGEDMEEAIMLHRQDNRPAQTFGFEITNEMYEEGAYLKDLKTGSVTWWNLGVILEEINRDRGVLWVAYTQVDWREGLEEWCSEYYEVKDDGA